MAKQGFDLLDQSSRGAGLGQALGRGIGKSLNFLIENKLNKIKQGYENQEKIQKNKASLRKDVSDYLRYANSPYKEHPNSIEEIYQNSKGYIDRGFEPFQAIEFAIKDYENPSPEPIESDLLEAAEQSPQKEKRGFLETLFLPKETEESLNTHKSALEKIQSTHSIKDLTKEELLSLYYKDLEHLTPEEKKKYLENVPQLSNEDQIRSMIAMLPFVGGSLEERYREKTSPTSPAPPPIASFLRFIGELPLLGGLLGLAGKGKGAVNLLKRAGLGAAVFGGEAALNEAIRTLGTKKPYDIKSPAISTVIGGLFPVGEKAISKMTKPLRNLIAKQMRKTGKTAASSIEKILEKSKNKGISIEDLKNGSKKEAKKFTTFLNEELKPQSNRVQKIAKFPISPQEARKKFESEAEKLAKSPIESYLKPSKLSPKAGERAKILQPQILKNNDRIKELTSKLRTETGKDLHNTRIELDYLKEKNRNLNYEIKYGKKPLSSSEMEKIATQSANNLIEMLKNPTAVTEKALQKNAKMMNTFLEREKKEIVQGLVPDKKTIDTFLNIQDYHLKAYNELFNNLHSSVKSPYKFIYTPHQLKLAKELQNRTSGIEAAIRVQNQKRHVLGKLKGGTGKFYRQMIDKIKKENNLFTKDMIKYGKETNKAFNHISKVGKERIEKIGRESVKKGKESIKKTAKNSGFTEKEASTIADTLEKIKNPPESAIKSFDDWRKFMAKKMGKLSLPIKNQLMMGTILGFIEEFYTQKTGKNIPHSYKTPFYAAFGLSGKRGLRRAFIPLSQYMAHQIFRDYSIKNAKKSLQSKRGKEYIEEYNRIKKKGFKKDEMKKILGQEE
jgi:hypothetical protein